MPHDKINQKKATERE